MTTKLNIKHDDDGSFTDYDLRAYNYDQKTFSFTLVAAEDYLYVAHPEKPIYSLFIAMSTPNTNANSLTAEYYNGTSWTSLSGFEDETFGLTENGFMRWDFNQDDQAKVTIDSLERYWVRFRPSADHSATTFEGINIVFNDDNDLVEVFPEITNFYPTGDSNFVRIAQAAKKEIVQRIRNSGQYIINTSGYRIQFDEWHVLDPQELREASKYKALELIFMNLADGTIDNVYYEKMKMYQAKFEAAFDLFFQTLDKDNDGIRDDSERIDINFPLIRTL